MRAFGLTLALLPGADKAPSYWSGDQVTKDTLESEEYIRLSHDRLSKVKDFVAGDEFHSSIFKAAISSIPRWRYARELQKKPADPKAQNIEAAENESDSDDDFKFVSIGKDTRGVVRAQRGFIEEARSMFHSKNVLVEFLVNRESGAPTLRLEIWRSVTTCIRGYTLSTFELSILFWPN